MRIGLIAGEGRLPLIFAGAVKAKGDTVIAFALKDAADKRLAECVDRIHWLGLGDFKKGLVLLAMERIGQIVLLGKFRKELFFKDADKFDGDAQKAMGELGDKNDYTILGQAAKILSRIGVKVVDPCAYLGDLFPKKGTLTKRIPADGERKDIEYGQMIVRTLAGHDIGQTIALKDRTVIAVEAMEGTDETIARAGKLVQGGFTVIKMARPHQDLRFDIPLVGLDTLKTMAASGAKVLALEADKTLLVGPEEVIRFADENGISIVII